MWQKLRYLPWGIWAKVLLGGVPERKEPVVAYKAKLGAKARDKLTGIDGTIVAITDWVNGCRRVTLQPFGIDKDGKAFSTHSADEPDLETVKEAPKAKAAKRTGGPMPEAGRRADA